MGGSAGRFGCLSPQVQPGMGEKNSEDFFGFADLRGSIRPARRVAPTLTVGLPTGSARVEDDEPHEPNRGRSDSRSSSTTRIKYSRVSRCSVSSPICAMASAPRGLEHFPRGPLPRSIERLGRPHRMIAERPPSRGLLPSWTPPSVQDPRAPISGIVDLTTGPSGGAAGDPATPPCHWDPSRTAAGAGGPVLPGTAGPIIRPVIVLFRSRRRIGQPRGRSL